MNSEDWQQKAGREFREYIEPRLAAQDFEGLCPEDGLHCQGFVGHPTQNISYPCPAMNDGTCPHTAERDTLADQEWLESLGFGLKSRGARWDQVRDLRFTIDLYCQTLRDRLRTGEGFVLNGIPGAGKTCILALVAVAARRVRRTNPPPTCYVRSRVAFDEFFACREIAEYHHVSWDARLVLFDDFGVESRHDLAMSRFQDWIDYRCDNRLSTIITTNLDRQTVEKDPTMARILSRLDSCGPWLETKAPDQRRKVRVGDWQSADPDPAAPQRLVVPHVE